MSKQTLMRAMSLRPLRVVGCGSSSSSGDDPGGDDGGGGNAPAVVDPAITSVNVEIDYETGEAPYTGSVVGFGELSEVTRTNVDRLFASTKTLTVPRTLGDMEDIGAIADESITGADALALAAAHRGLHDTSSSKAYYIVFVSGHFADGNGDNPNVLGVSFGDTGVIVMFKDVIRSTANVTFPNGEKFVEQTTLLHELAHGIGLVDNGLPMATPHKDAEHGAHCDDNSCVMYWANELGASALAFAQQYMLSSDKILFDAQCLADVDKINGRD